MSSIGSVRTSAARWRVSGVSGMPAIRTSASSRSPGSSRSTRRAARATTASGWSGSASRPQGGLVAGRQQAFEFRLLLRRQEAGDEVAHEGLALCPHEGVGGPTVDHGVDGGDGLGLEGLGDPGVLVDVHLGEDYLATGLADDLLEDWPQLGTGPTPGCPEVDYDRDLCRAVEDLGLEGGVGDIHGFVSRFPRWHGGGFAVQGRETPRRLHYRSPP